ncbi:FAD-dependent monooxygenase, partial [Streptomyces sp. NPDC047009]|uniref:FAD-dependent monooxygenase n=1 Tax=Streptomyces sp. NPDC047009 TaxID=3154496 RepID=UPI0033CE0A88
MTATAPEHVPVAVIGAGPTGLTAATLLARHGVPTLVLERHRAPYPLPRAVHLDDEVHRILQAVGIHETFSEITRPARGCWPTLKMPTGPALKVPITENKIAPLGWSQRG